MNKKNIKETTKKARVISNATGQCPVFFYEEIQQYMNPYMKAKNRACPCPCYVFKCRLCSSPRSFTSFLYNC